MVLVWWGIKRCLKLPQFLNHILSGGPLCGPMGTTGLLAPVLSMLHRGLTRATGRFRTLVSYRHRVHRLPLCGLCHVRCVMFWLGRLPWSEPPLP